jgi:hypothetical protein
MPDLFNLVHISNTPILILLLGNISINDIIIIGLLDSFNLIIHILLGGYVTWK